LAVVPHVGSRQHRVVTFADVGGRSMDVHYAEELGSAIARAVGEELRRARDARGFTREELVARLPFRLHAQTLAAYERGTIQCTIRRFVEICRVIGAPAPDVLSWALQRAEVDLQFIGIQIDLPALLKDTKAELAPLRNWASKRLASSGEAGIVRLQLAALQEMAVLFDIDQTELVRELIRFTPQPAPKQQ
jgi:transcriptional regulator with XRE-family HTH domain